MEAQSTSIIPLYWLIGALILFGLLVVFILLMVKAYVARIRKEEEEKIQLHQKHHQELLKNSIDIQEKERLRIASDIHDGLIGHLYQIQFQNNDPKLNDKIKTSIQLSRSISHDLSPPLIESSSLEELFELFLTAFEDSFKICFHHSKLGEPKINTTQKLHLYRIFQEVIVNIQKHAQSKSIDVRMKSSDNGIILVIRDSGIGFKGQQEGLGMKNINLRAKQLKANYRFKPTPNGGTSFFFIFYCDGEH